MPMTAAQKQLASTQRAAVKRVQAREGVNAGLAFVHAKKLLAPHLRTFARSYGAELVRQRELQDDDEGARVPLTWLHSSGGLGALKSSMQTAVHDASRLALAATMNGQYQAAIAGYTAAHDWPDVDEETHPTIAPQRMGTSGYDGAPLIVYFDRLGPKAAAKAGQRAYVDTSRGAEEDQLQSDLADVLDWAEEAALLVTLSEVASLFTDALMTAVNQGWVWDAAPDACPICAELNGTEYDAGEEFQPAHPRCYCQPIPRANVLGILSF